MGLEKECEPVTDERFWLEEDVEVEKGCQRKGHF